VERQILHGLKVGGVTADGRNVDVSVVDLGLLLNQTGDEVQIAALPNSTPTVQPDGLFGFECLRVNLACLDLQVDSNDLTIAWMRLRDSGLPLDDILSGLILLDILQAIRGLVPNQAVKPHAYTPAVPSFAHLVRLVGLIEEARRTPPGSITGLDNRIADLRRKLRGGLKRAKADPSIFPDVALRWLNDLIASSREFEVLKQLVAIGYRCDLPRSGVDILLPELGQLAIEVKLRTDSRVEKMLHPRRKLLTEPMREMRLNQRVLTLWLAAKVAGRIEHAFSDQGSQILACDLTYAFPLPLLPAVRELWSLDTDFRRALQQAISLARNGTEAVVIFTGSIGLEHRWDAIVMTRKDVEILQRKLAADIAASGVKWPEVLYVLG
jgi:hypothetical protein